MYQCTDTEEAVWRRNQDMKQQKFSEGLDKSHLTRFFFSNYAGALLKSHKYRRAQCFCSMQAHDDLISFHIMDTSAGKDWRDLA